MMHPPLGGEDLTKGNVVEIDHHDTFNVALIAKHNLVPGEAKRQYKDRANAPF